MPAKSYHPSRAARLLGIKRVTVWNRMRKYSIDLEKVLRE
jgi:transcriptional regulator of acetoin/glycerol metabolism